MSARSHQVVIAVLLCGAWLGAAQGEANPRAATAATVTINSTLTGHTSEWFVTPTLDFWLANDTRYGQAWGDAGIFLLNLKEKKLATMASAFAGGIIRLGGSPEDSVWYDIDGGCVPGAPPPASVNSGSRSSYYCSQVKPEVYGCLSPQRWEELLSWAADVGLGIVLGLNACNGRSSPDSPADLSNIESLLRYTASLPETQRSALAGVEFGNELQDTITADAWAADADITFVGPDVWGPPTYFSELLSKVPPGTIDAITYHQYVNCVPSGSDATVLPLDCLEAIHSTGDVYAPIAQGGGVQLWVGESAEHSGGGIEGLTNTFTSSFFYAYQMGVIGMVNGSVTARQDLIGGHYGLIDKETFEPNPDYWVALIWRNVLGKTRNVMHAVLDRESESAGLRAFAQCQPSGPFVLVFVNFLKNRDYSISLNLPGGANAAGNRGEWHLTGNLTSSRIALNGNLLQLSPGGDLPSLQPVQKPANSPVAVKAASIAFVRLEGVPCSEAKWIQP